MDDLQEYNTAIEHLDAQGIDASEIAEHRAQSGHLPYARVTTRNKDGFIETIDFVSDPEELEYFRASKSNFGIEVAVLHIDYGEHRRILEKHL